MHFKTMGLIALAGVLGAMAPRPMQAQAGGDTLLKPADMQKLVPASVYYRGQTATTQVRNSGGVKFGDGTYVLSYLVDTSGYSSDVAAKYQAYFITESGLKVGGKPLAAGIYGIGFVGDRFIVTDVGGHDLVTVASTSDAGLKRPMPLQITPNPGGGYRLYGGRKYVVFAR